MRTATIYNFLLEANLMASVAILLMIVIRKFLRKPLGNRLIYCLWLLIAIRLLCPLALGNPLINEYRPTFLQDEAIRPIAGQIKVRFEDAVGDVSNRYHTRQDSLIFRGARDIEDGMYYGTLGRRLMGVYLYVAGGVLLLFFIANVRFRRRLKANRIERISGKLEEQYLAICKDRGVKPIPVWFVDPLPSACLVGVVHPYIALPLTAAPQEAAYVLTHEVCHYRGKDHWVSILRLLCCVVHWFNPLVWLAAHLSRTDGELACDSRVVRGLSQNDRVNYTNTLVLAASKRYAPGVGVLATGMTMTGKKLQHRVRSILNDGRTVKWLMGTVAALACLAFAAAFFTAEYYAYPKLPTPGVRTELLAALPPVNEDEALQRAKTFFAGDTFGLDLSGAQWKPEETDATYEFQVYPTPDAMPVTLTMLKDGTITSFFIPSDFDRAMAVDGLYSKDTDRQEELAMYIVNFWEANQPETANQMEAMRFASEGAFGEQRFVTFFGPNAASDTAFMVSLQVLPQVRMISFHTDSAMLRYLLGDTKSASVPAYGQSYTIRDFQSEDLARDNSRFTAPPADAMALDTALNLGIQAIVDTFQESSMTRFSILYGYVTAESAPNADWQTPYWQFSFRVDANPEDCYDVTVHSPDGAIVFLAGPEDGNG